MSSLVGDISGLHYTIFMKWPNSVFFCASKPKAQKQHHYHTSSSAKPDEFVPGDELNNW